MSVREYVGARYVPKFSDKNGGTWDNTYSYEALEIVKYGNDYYTAKIPVPVGEAITDTTYWVLTGNYNGAIATLTGRVTALETDVAAITNLKWYNIADYNMNPGDQIYDDLFDLLHDVVAPAGGGVVYFPEGTYYLDYTIVIPDNTMFIGTGDTTRILFDLTDTYIGGAFSTGGSNITIMNMNVDIDTNVPYNVRGSLPNSIGITDLDFDLMTVKRSHTLYRKAISNIRMINVNSLFSNYGIGIEPAQYKINNVWIENHSVPTGMFAAQIFSAADLIENVFCNNIVCDSVRIGVGYHGFNNFNIDGLFTKQIVIGADNINITNFTIEGSRGNRINGADFEINTITAFGKHLKFSNGRIYNLASSPQTRLLNAGYLAADRGDIWLDNIKVDDLSSYTTDNYLETADVYANNLNFETYPASYKTIVLASGVYEFSHNTIPSTFRYDCNTGKCMIDGIYTYDGTDNFKIGDLPSWFMGSPIKREAFGRGIAYNVGSEAVAPMPVTVHLDGSTGEITIKRLTAPSTWTGTYTAVVIHLEW